MNLGADFAEHALYIAGGGLNSTLSAGVITMASPLAPNNSINVHFTLGVMQGGNFRIFVNVEALP